MRNLYLKRYKIYKSSRFITKQKLSIQSSCQKTNVRGDKYVNDRKTFKGKKGCYIQINHNTQRLLIPNNYCYISINFFNKMDPNWEM